MMWDAARDAAGEPTNRIPVNASLVAENGATTLVLRPSVTWLNDATTQYPVVVDPDVSEVRPYGDAHVPSTAQSSPETGQYYLYAGRKGGSPNPIWRTFFSFTIDQYVGRVITNAKLNVSQIGTASCATRGTQAAPSVPKNTSDLTWGQSTKTDQQWVSPTSNAMNGNGTPCGSNTGAIVQPGPVYFDVTKEMTGWATGVLDSDTKAANVDTANGAQNLATFRVAAADESLTDTLKTYCSVDTAAPETGSYCADPTHGPTLSLTYFPDLGVSKSFALDKHNLDSRSQLSINQDGGDAVVQTRDLSIKGIGQDLTLDRYYNSGYPTAPTSSLGTTGWGFSFGADVSMEVPAYDPLSRLIYHAPDGHAYGPFIRKSSDSSNPDYYKFESIKYGDIDADLTADGAQPDYLTLTTHESQNKYVFRRVDNNSSSFYLATSTDRNGNTITTGYVTGTHQMSGMSDGVGRTLSIAYNTDGYVSQITDANGPTTRTWKYVYNASGALTKFTDPTGANTVYGYTNYTIGSTTRQLLTSVVNPAKSDGNKPETRIEYTAGQATRALYRTGSGTSDFATFTYNYYSSFGGGCPTRADRYTIRVDNKNAGQTTYCFANRQSDGSGNDGSAATDVLDNYAHKQSTTFNPDSKITSSISPSNQGSGGSGATKVSYGADSSGLLDQVDTVTAPSNGDDSSKAGKETYKYNASSSIPGYKYLPTSKYDANGVCTAYAYYTTGTGGGALGQIRAAYLGAETTVSGGKDCSGNTTVDNNGAHNAWYATYNPNGTLASTWDSNAPSASGSPAAADRTIYSYWASGDTGIAANGVGELKAVVKPGGSCSAPRKLCTSYTYDGLGRVLTMTDGRGKVTSYTYDKNDRTTQILFDGATVCTLAAGTCIKYNYDDEGNLYQRQDGAGTTTISWDWLNQQKTQATPDGSSTTNTWDASGHLLQYDQSVKVGSNIYNDTVGYTYDDANMVTTVTDNPGTANARIIKTDRDANGRLFRNRFATPQVSNSFGFTKSGAAATASAEPVSGGVNRQFFNFRYDYNDEDKNGNETTHLQNVRSVNHPGAGLLNYDYDYTLNRLINVKVHVNDVKLWEYLYDDAGNIKQYNITPGTQTAATTHYGVDGSGNLCWTSDTAPGAYHATGCPTAPTSSGTATYSQDAAGNNTGTTTSPILYNALNQASSIAGETKSYLDKDNNLLTGTGVGASARAYTFGTIGLTAAAGATGTPTFYTRDTDGRILDSHGPGASSYYYYLLDGQKSVAGLVNDTGVLQGVYTYNPFGAASIKNADGTPVTGTTPLTLNPFRYRGGFVDSSGLYHFGARFYNSSTMRWTQPDPEQGKISDPASLNSFGYAQNDPTDESDLTGRFSEEDAGEALAGAFTIGGSAEFASAAGEIIGAGTVAGGLIGGALAAAAIGGIVLGAFLIKDATEDDD